MEAVWQSALQLRGAGADSLHAAGHLLTVGAH
jgi:hypothetical protein